ncbi:MAG: DUF2141 domain-containing protein [Roseiarcus sp.]
MILAAATSDAAASDKARLVVNAQGFEDSRGQAVAKLFQPVDNVLGRGHWEISAKISQGAAKFVFDNLEPGPYAVVVFHDQNANGVIDHNAIGFPAEPLGFSNGFSLGLTSGLPSFERLKFQISGPETSISVHVK